MPESARVEHNPGGSQGLHCSSHKIQYPLFLFQFMALHPPLPRSLAEHGTCTHPSLSVHTLGDGFQTHNMALFLFCGVPRRCTAWNPEPLRPPPLGKSSSMNRGSSSSCTRLESLALTEGVSGGGEGGRGRVALSGVGGGCFLQLSKTEAAKSQQKKANSRKTNDF